MLAILAATRLLALPAALAQDATRHPYQLAGAPLDKTLLRIAAESGVALAYDPKLVETARSAPVSGNFSATEAITRALEGRALSWPRAPAGARGRYAARPFPWRMSTTRSA